MRYRLPESLGGGECTPHAGEDVDERMVRVWVQVADDEAALVTIRGALLAKVEDPLPPEPPPLTVVLAGGALFRRHPDDDDAWFNPFSTKPHFWHEVCDWAKPGTPVRLVPDPAAGVELPWVGATLDAEPIGVRRADGWRVRILLADGHGEHYADLNAKGAREMAAALLAAADAAEAVTT